MKKDKSKKQSRNDSEPSPQVSKMILKNASLHHLEAFDFGLDTCLKRICKYMLPVEVLNSSPEERRSKQLPVFPFESLRLWFESFELRKPLRQDGEMNLASFFSQSQHQQSQQDQSNSVNLYPAECRLRRLTYSAPLFATFCRKVDGEPEEKIVMQIGEVPVMVRSKFCNLQGLNEEELVKMKEDLTEFGGYFIINGNERLIRMIITTKRNYPLAFQRPNFTNRNKLFTPYAVQIRSVRDDLFSQTVTAHYLSDGNCFIRLVYNKQELLFPAYVLLKAMQEVPDALIYLQLVKGNLKNRQIGDRVEVLLQEGQKLGLSSQGQCLGYLGARLRSTLVGVEAAMSDIEVGRFFLERHVLVHAAKMVDKFNCLCLMIEKLYAAIAGECELDNLDAPSNQEILLGGHLYAQLLAEKLYDLLLGAKAKIYRDFKSNSFTTEQFRSESYMKQLISQQQSVGKKMETFLANGNLVSRNNLDLMQTSGFTIMAEKLNNARFLSHFRSIHRGQYFTEMKTTTVRKLLPEAWGFLCPVHTPDGAPCGLLNHISMSCLPVSKEPIDLARPQILNKFKKVLEQFGMQALNQEMQVVYPFDYLPVVMEGVVLGYVAPDKSDEFVQTLRKHKVDQKPLPFIEGPLPHLLEVSYLPATAPSDHASQKDQLRKQNFFPGIFLAVGVGRFARPVQNLQAGGIEWIGPLEQVNLSIACLEEDLRSDSTHQEIDPIYILSIIAATIPFSEFNQSPRNMYQCQMFKQTMGTPYHNHPYRMDNKVYRILFPQDPLVRTQAYSQYSFSEFPSGTNAVVAVISYTGYDMEDAMILNKSAFERGFGHAAVYKSEVVEVNEEGTKGQRFRMVNSAKNREDGKLPLWEKGLDSDGLPSIGRKLHQGDAEQCTYDNVNQKPKYKSFKDQESATIEQVRLLGTPNSTPNFGFTLRYGRNPVIGDKFSSRHGQKGVLSVLWPQEDMPFTGGGITPDVIINPHAFPSRMTIGMLIESLGAKSGALEGQFKQVKAFDKYADDDAVQVFGEELAKRGFNYYGNETMYSGIFGEEMKVEIFIGLVYYQRLRHMVSDKSQARATGPIDVLTHQPVKGRKKQGGIRVGEMERDSLLAHGAAFCLNDRLMRCSDYSEGYVCVKCGSMLASYKTREVWKGEIQENKLNVTDVAYCRVCDRYDCKKVAMPYVLRYLTNELAAMNIKIAFQLEREA